LLRLKPQETSPATGYAFSPRESARSDILDSDWGRQNIPGTRVTTRTIVRPRDQHCAKLQVLEYQWLANRPRREFWGTKFRDLPLPICVRTNPTNALTRICRNTPSQPGQSSNNALPPTVPPPVCQRCHSHIYERKPIALLAESSVTSPVGGRPPSRPFEKRGAVQLMLTRWWSPAGSVRPSLFGAGAQPRTSKLQVFPTLSG